MPKAALDLRRQLHCVGSNPERWRVDCPLCSFHAVRAKMDAALHCVAQHVPYAHDREVKV